MKKNPHIHLLIRNFLFCCFLACVLSITGFGQLNSEARYKLAQQFYNQQKNDSAILQLKGILSAPSKNIKQQATAYNLLARIYRLKGQYNDVFQCDSLNTPTILLLKDTSLLIESLHRQGTYFFENARNEQAEEIYKRMLLLGIERKDMLLTAEINNNLGSIYLNKGKYETAGNYLFKALRLYNEKHDGKGVSETYDNLSTLYFLLGKRDEALQYQLKSKECKEQINDKTGLCLSNISIGKYYIMADQFDIGASYFKKAVSLADEMNNKKLQALAAEAMVIYYVKVDNFKDAFPWQKKSLELFEQLGKKEKLPLLYVSVAQSYHRLGDSLQAIKSLEKGLSLSLELSNQQFIANTYIKLSWFFEAHNNLSAALNYYKKFVEYDDSLKQKDKFAKIEVFKFQYQTEKKENELNKLTAQQHLQQLQLEKQQALLTASLLETKSKQDQITLLANNKEINELTISEQKKEIEKQKLLAENNRQEQLLAQKENLLSEQHLASSKKIRNLLLVSLVLLLILGWVFFNRYNLKKTIQQQQTLLHIRNTISNDLHDEIGSTLTSINILSNVSQQALQQQPDKAKEMLAQISNQSKQIQQNMSDIVWSIKPDNEKFENLLLRMKEYASNTLEQQNIDVEFYETGNFSQMNLPMEFRKEILLIFKEAINNVVKHAKATQVKVNVLVNKQSLDFTIWDNGHWSVKPGTTGSGLRSMQQRANTMQGSFAINYSDTGTTLKLIVPRIT